MTETDATALNDRICNLATPLAADLGLAVWGLELLRGPRLVIRLYVDTPPEGVSSEGVSIDQCARLSRSLGLALEVEDIIPSAYVLEISSPGLERPFFRLMQLAPYIGHSIAFSLAAPIPACPGRKHFVGALKHVADTFFTVTVDDAPPFSKNAPGHVDISWNLVKNARLIHVFPDELKAKPKAGAGKAAKDASRRRAGGIKHMQPA